jgi:hypothetical protein
MNLEKAFIAAKRSLDEQVKEEELSVSDGEELRKQHLLRDVHFLRQDIALLVLTSPIALRLMNQIVRLLWACLIAGILILLNLGSR